MSTPVVFGIRLASPCVEVMSDLLLPLRLEVYGGIRPAALVYKFRCKLCGGFTVSPERFVWTVLAFAAPFMETSGFGDFCSVFMAC